MGNNFSTNSPTFQLFFLLKKKNCSRNHPIWSNFSIYDLYGKDSYKYILPELIEIYQKKPENFNELIRIIIELFNKLINSNEKDKKSILLFCELILLIITISGFQQNISPWYKTPPLYLSSLILFDF